MERKGSHIQFHAQVLTFQRVADVEPLIARPMYGVSTSSLRLSTQNLTSESQALHPESSVMFVSQASAAKGGDVQSYNLRKQIEVVKNCRTVKKHDLKFNDATPKIEVDPNTLVSHCKL